MNHLTTEELIAIHYGLPNDHFADCLECHTRLAAMVANRLRIEQESDASDVNHERLLAQRRAVLARVSTVSHWWQGLRLWQWASMGAASAALGIALMLNGDISWHQEPAVSDAQLAQEVSSMSVDIESPHTAPLEGLFE